MAANSGYLLFNHGIPPAASPAHVFGQEWRNTLQSVRHVPLDPTPAVLDANPYIGSDDIQLTQVSRVPGPVDNNQTWAKLIDQSPHLDHLTGYVSLLLNLLSVYTSHEIHILSLELPPLTNRLTGDSRNDNP